MADPMQTAPQWAPTRQSTPEPPPLGVLASRRLPIWMAEQSCSLAFTTYQANKLLLLGIEDDTRLALFNRTFSRCMGLQVTGATLWLSTLYQLWRLENCLRSGERYRDYDSVFVPRLAYTTGDIDVHEIGLDRSGRPIFVNTLFSCLAAASERYSFEPLWRPPFVSRLAAEDRCHLNGLAMEAGEPRYVMAASRSDVADGWREHRRRGGVVIDVQRNEIVLDGLSMPHSPRLHGGRLWLLDSGTGHFGYADLEHGRFERVAFCPGYARGLSFVGGFAVVGLSRARHDHTFSGLELQENLASKGAEPRCGLIVIDLDTGDIVHWLRITGLIEELYDLQVLPGVARPMALGF